MFLGGRLPLDHMPRDLAKVLEKHKIKFFVTNDIENATEFLRAQEENIECKPFTVKIREEPTRLYRAPTSSSEASTSEFLTPPPSEPGQRFQIIQNSTEGDTTQPPAVEWKIPQSSGSPPCKQDNPPPQDTIHQDNVDSRLAEFIKNLQPPLSGIETIGDYVYNAGRPKKIIPRDRPRTNSPVYRCRICEKVLMFKYALEKHVRLQHGERPYQCDRCLKTFAFTNYLEKHKEQNECIVCSMCGQLFCTRSELQRHLKPGTPLSCPRLTKRIYCV